MNFDPPLEEVDDGKNGRIGGSRVDPGAQPAGGKVAKMIWAPLSAKDSDAVVATVVGGNRVSFFEQ
jgi:hypothetical protein